MRQVRLKLIRYKKYVPLTLLTIIFFGVIWSFFAGKTDWNEAYEKYENVVKEDVPDADAIKKNTVLLEAPEEIKIEAYYNALILRWDEVEGATGYDVEADGVVTEYLYKPEFTHENLKFDTAHHYRVRTRNFDTAGPWSEAVIGVTANNNMKDIAGQFKALVYGKSIILSWAPVDEAISYAVEADGKIIEDLGKSGQELTYIHEGLILGSSHKYRIRTKFQDRLSGWSPYLNMTLTRSQPEGTVMRINLDGKIDEWTEKTLLYYDKATKTKFYCAQSEEQIGLALASSQLIGSTSIYLDLDENPKTGYQGAGFSIGGAEILIDGSTVYRYEGSGMEWKWKNVGEISVVTNGTITEMLVEKEHLNKKGFYPLRIGYVMSGSRLVPMEQEMLSSFVQMFLDPSFLKPPKNISLNFSSTAAFLAWEPAPYAGSYEIEINGKQIVSTEHTRFRHSGLSALSKHQYRIRSIVDGRKSPWSSSFSGQTQSLAKIPAFIQVDGKDEDWKEIKATASDKNGLVFKAVKDNQKTYFLIQGANEGAQIQVFIDADASSATGYRGTGWIDSGADYLLAGSSVYRYAGTGMDWQWQSLKEVQAASQNNVFEFAVMNREINVTGEFEAGISVNDVIFLPTSQNHMARVYQDIYFEPALLKPPTAIMDEVLVKSIKVSWAPVEGAEGYEVEFDGKTADCGLNTEVSYVNLSPDSLHSYRVRVKMNGFTGAWSALRELRTKGFKTAAASTIFIDGSKGDWQVIEPLGKSQDGTYKLSGVMDKNKLYILMERQNRVGSSTLYIDSDGSKTTGYTGTEWKNAGIDYVIENGFVYKYLGKGPDWNFGAEKELIHYAETEKLIEMAVDLQDLGKNGADTFYVGVNYAAMEIPQKNNSLLEVYEVLK